MDKKPGINKKGRALWALRNAHEKGDGHSDPSTDRQIESRASVRQALWEAQVSSPTAALEEAETIKNC